MNNKLYISLIVLFTIIGIYFLNIKSQKNYESSSKNLFDIRQDDIKKFIIQNSSDAIEIIKHDTSWHIAGHDSLTIKKQILDNFLNKTMNLKIQNTMTTKEEKWSKFNVDDSSGTHLALIDWNDKTLGYFVFGRSNSDYQRCYVRNNQSSNVYLLNENIVFSLQTRPEYWGEKIKADDGLESMLEIPE